MPNYPSFWRRTILDLEVIDLLDEKTLMCFHFIDIASFPRSALGSRITPFPREIAAYLMYDF